MLSYPFSSATKILFPLILRIKTIEELTKGI